MSPSLKKLHEKTLYPSSRSTASPLLQWVKENKEVIEALRYEKGVPWQMILEAAIADGLEIQNHDAGRKHLRGMWQRLLKAENKRRASTPKIMTEIAPVPKETSFYPSRLPKGWQPDFVKNAYPDVPAKENHKPENKSVLVAERSATLAVEPDKKNETGSERAARLTAEAMEDLRAMQRERDPYC